MTAKTTDTGETANTVTAHSAAQGQKFQILDSAQTPEGLIAERERVERERVEMVNRLLEKRRQVVIDADADVRKLTEQLRALGWKASRNIPPRTPNTPKTA